MSFPMTYHAELKLLICHHCEAGVLPGRRALESHLRSAPHCVKGAVLKITLGQSGDLEYNEPAELERLSAARERLGQPIPRLRLHDGVACPFEDCPAAARSARLLREHMAKQHEPMPDHAGLADADMEPCRMQTLLAAKVHVRYFSVLAQPLTAEQVANKGRPEEKEVFAAITENLGHLARDVSSRADVVHGQALVRQERIPWLERAGFPSHLDGLLDSEIRTSYRLVPGRELEGAMAKGLVPAALQTAAELMFKRAYGLCRPGSEHNRMTQQRAIILCEFRTGASPGGRSHAFRSHKDPSTLIKYLTTWKQMLVYLYRVVHCADQGGHFSKARRHPSNVIRPTERQAALLAEFVNGVGQTDTDGQATLLLDLSWELIGQVVGDNPFRSVIWSYAAMKSRLGRETSDGGWESASNFNSHLSALVWVGQLLVFAHVCRECREEEDQIPVRLAEACRTSFQQTAETPFGHILQLRLYLFQVAKQELTRHQVTWLLEDDKMQYRGQIHSLTDIPTVVEAEYGDAGRLLYRDLMFSCDSRRMHASQLRDDLDNIDYDFSWLKHHENTLLLEGSSTLLLRQLQASAEMRATYVQAGPDGKSRISPAAIDIYEAYAQTFLKSMLLLIQLTSGQPLREPELLSVWWKNTDSRRNIVIWDGVVMLHTTYHKGQEQTGTYKHNVRVLPAAVGDMLLDFLAYVQPLRQIFLRCRRPDEVLSPYLWASLDGAVWPDGKISACLSKACTRLAVSRLHTSNWRQLSAAICKHRFTPGEQKLIDPYGDVELPLGREDEDEELQLLALQGNHSYATFNHAYAGSSSLSTNALLWQGRRASELWHNLFDFQRLLTGVGQAPAAGTKRKAPDDPRTLEETIRVATVRHRPDCIEEELLMIARQMYGDPSMQFKQPGQLQAVRTMLGRDPPEQLVLVLGTGGGKSLVFQLGAMLPRAETTILVVPLVALRLDMLERCKRLGIRTHCWTPGSRHTSPLVLVSAEAVQSTDFMEYAQELQRRQCLDRIVVDECHLTVTASEYRPCMAKLASQVRRIPTQSVWMTATLPPAWMQTFTHANKLVRPDVIRQSTARGDITYLIERVEGPMMQGVAVAVRAMDVGGAGGKIIVFCRSKRGVSEVAAALKSSSFTSESGTPEEKAAILEAWIADDSQPYMVATSALGPGFDHAHVRAVVHAGPPEEMTSFAQESGRAGRDGKGARSIVLLPAAWTPARPGTILPSDQQAMQDYLLEERCLRRVMGDFLDEMEEDCGRSGWLKCGVCLGATKAVTSAKSRWATPPLHGSSPRPWVEGMPAAQSPTVTRKAAPCTPRNPKHESSPLGPGPSSSSPMSTFKRPMPPPKPLSELPSGFGGTREVLEQERQTQLELERYRRDLDMVRMTCMFCRLLGVKEFDHLAGECGRRKQWTTVKTEHLQLCKREGKAFVAPYHACYHCYQPQTICRKGGGSGMREECRYPDIAWSTSLGLWFSGRKEWLHDTFKADVKDVTAYVAWLGKKYTFGGDKALNMTQVTKVVLEELCG